MRESEGRNRVAAIDRQIIILLVALVVVLAALVALWPGDGPEGGDGSAGDLSGSSSSAEPFKPAYVVAAGRSPIPHEGEEITELIPAEKVVAPEDIVADTEPPDGVVPWTEAHRYLGHEITTEGVIVQTNNLGHLCFLNFTDEPRGGDRFYIIIFQEAYGAFPSGPENDLRGKMVRVTGKVSLFKNRPQMPVHDAKQVEVVGKE